MNYKSHKPIRRTGVWPSNYGYDWIHRARKPTTGAAMHQEMLAQQPAYDKPELQDYVNRVPFGTDLFLRNYSGEFSVP